MVSLVIFLSAFQLYSPAQDGTRKAVELNTHLELEAERRPASLSCCEVAVAVHRSDETLSAVERHTSCSLRRERYQSERARRMADSTCSVRVRGGSRALSACPDVIAQNAGRMRVGARSCLLASLTSYVQLARLGQALA